MIGLFALSCILTGCYRQYALSRRILDIPNDRSAHQRAVPRGGGAIFVSLFLGSCLYYFPSQLPLLMVTLGIAMIGYFDDIRSIPAVKRLVLHILLSAASLVILGGMPDLCLYHWTIHFGFVTSMVGVLYLVWMLNLYNFMDGINGLAGCEALCVSIGIVVVYVVIGEHTYIILPCILMAVVAGFLLYNFPRATLFMGDVGSSFLGFTFGIWSLQSATIQPQLFWSWMILLGVFVVDATTTLVWRMARNEPIYLAHSTHAYQFAARYYDSHTTVTMAVVIINILWLLPLAVLVSLGYLDGIMGVIIAYLPLLGITVHFKSNCSFS